MVFYFVLFSDQKDLCIFFSICIFCVFLAMIWVEHIFASSGERGLQFSGDRNVILRRPKTRRS